LSRKLTHGAIGLKRLIFKAKVQELGHVDEFLHYVAVFKSTGLAKVQDVVIALKLKRFFIADLSFPLEVRFAACKEKQRVRLTLGFDFIQP
jgi:hypothetical protein